LKEENRYITRGKYAIKNVISKLHSTLNDNILSNHIYYSCIINYEYLIIVFNGSFKNITITINDKLPSPNAHISYCDNIKKTIYTCKLNSAVKCLHIINVKLYEEIDTLFFNIIPSYTNNYLNIDKTILFYIYHNINVLNASNCPNDKFTKFLILIVDNRNFNIDEYFKLSSQSYSGQWEIHIIKPAENRNTVNVNPYLKITYTNENVVEAIQRCISQSNSDYLLFLDENCHLNKYALNIINNKINDFEKSPVLLFGNYLYDLDVEIRPQFRAKLDKTLLLSRDYLFDLIIVKRQKVDCSTSFISEYYHKFKYELLLRLISNYGLDQIQHINSFITKCCNKAVQEFIIGDRTEHKQIVQHYLSNCKLHKQNKTNSPSLQYGVNTDELISIIIPFKDNLLLLKSCVNSIRQKTNYLDYEIILVNNRSINQETHDYANEISKKHTNIHLIQYDKKFNYSDLNNIACQYTNGNTLLFLNNDTKVITENWLTSLKGYIDCNEVGIVGAQLLYEDRSIQHQGVFYGLLKNKQDYIIDHIGKYNEYEVYPNSIKECSAVTGACLMISKFLFKKVAMFDSKLPNSFNDVDLCFKVNSLGYKIIVNNEVKLFHYESKTRDPKYMEIESINYFVDKWKFKLEKKDELYNIDNVKLSHNLVPIS